MIKHERSWASLQTRWEKIENSVASVTQPRYLTKSTERMVLSIDKKIPRTKSSFGRKRVSFDSDLIPQI